MPFNFGEQFIRQTRIDPDCLLLRSISSGFVADLDEHEIPSFFSGPFLGKSDDIWVEVGLLSEVPHCGFITKKSGECLFKKHFDFELQLT